MRRPLWIPWRWWRRAAQFAVLVAFLWLFRRTEYTGSDELGGGEHFLFHLDPLAGAAAMLGARQFIVAFVPALAILALTMVWGRFFCGWICPLGTLLDYFHRLTRPIARRTNRLFQIPNRTRAIKYVLLIAVLISAVFAFPLVGWVDPFALLVRGLTFWADPALFRGVDTMIGWLGDGDTAEKFQPAIQFVRKHLLPFNAMTFQLVGVSAALLASIFFLEFVARRFWCRYVCPAGAIFGLFSRRSAVKRLPAVVCKTCGRCATDCRMNALDATTGLSPEECTLCMDCVSYCPTGVVQFRRKKSPARKLGHRPVDLTRRGLLTGIAAGAAIPGVALAARLGQEKTVSPYLLRPPGAGDESTFLNLCIRCGECMKVCPTNVLQPMIFESGLEGVFSPHLIPRYIFEQSFCEYSCTLCGQVCPTGAIPRLTEEEKHAEPIGKAYFDHHRCLPWAEETPCIRCEEMCPAPEKAIKIFKTYTIKGKDGADVEIHQPYVDRDLCVGCGICESNCTIEGVSAIRVQRVESPDPGTEFLLKGEPEKKDEGTPASSNPYG